jgi:predicted TIM-barrel fold metal-dependent hydrolase
METHFASLPVIDSHVHFVHPERMDEILSLMDAVPCYRFNLVCVPNPDATTHNPAALYFKTRYPDRVYISGALDYSVLIDPVHAPKRLAEQIPGLKAAGFDGLKLIEGKPQVRKLLPYPLDGPLYAGMWSVLEQEGFPVVFHVNDPDEFWNNCPAWARDAGWDYSDGTYPSKEDLYCEVERILGRHPGLKIIFAHFCFLSHDLGRLGNFLEIHPGVCVDLAPHLDMYRHFTANPAAAREFFLRFQDRILYGTDTDTRALQRGVDGFKFMRSLPILIRSMLEMRDSFIFDDGHTYHGLDLPKEALEKIYHANFERIFGLVPAMLVGKGMENRIITSN